MKKIIADLHVHSIASGHAYNTIYELTQASKQKNIELIAITDHGPKMPQAPHAYYFGNLKVVPETINGVRVLKGIETNILEDGHLDLEDMWLEVLEFCAAGYHIEAMKPKSKDENTKFLINAMKNKYIKMITHPDNPNYPVDFQQVCKAASDYGVILELNNSSYNGDKKFKRCDEALTMEMLNYLIKYNVYTSLNSDAHWMESVGNIEKIQPFVDKASIPEELIINNSIEKILNFIK